MNGCSLRNRSGADVTGAMTGPWKHARAPMKPSRVLPASARPIGEAVRWRFIQIYYRSIREASWEGFYA